MFQKFINKYKKNKVLNYYPFIKFNILKKFFKIKKKKKVKVKNINIYKLSIIIFSFLKKKSNFIFLYTGKKFIQFKFLKLKIFLIIGEFITTRVINSGKILHKRKKK